jgi:hypothetical protein
MYYDAPLDKTTSDEEEEDTSSDEEEDTSSDEEENTSSDREEDIFSDGEGNTSSEENTSSDEENTSSDEEGDTSSGANKDEDEDLNMDVNRETRYSELEANSFCYSKVKAMRDKLLDGYKVPIDPPHSPPIRQTLTRSEELTLGHFVAWSKSKGTVKAYVSHAAVLEKATGIKILSLHLAKQLAAKLTDLKPIKVDMCPSSCIAYAGEYKDHIRCPFISSEKGRAPCGKPRYKPSSRRNPKAYAQVLILPIIPTIMALYANAETSRLLRQRDTHLKQAIHLLYTASQQKTYSDFSDSKVHCMHHEARKLFQDPRDIAFAISTDGAQLTMKKQSNTWIVVLILFSLPGDVRYKGYSTTIPMAIPGPNSPGYIESFLYMLFEDMTRASEGIWIWDAVDSSYFVLRAHLCMMLGDMLGSAKCSGMAGHSAVFGDRFSLVQGARSKKTKGAKAQYYPMSPPDNDKKEYNPSRPTYNLDNLPMRTESHYWSTIEKLCKASDNAKATSRITRATGISCLPLCATSLAFSHPTFFPMDPLHLCYENCMAFLYDLWRASQPGDIFYIPEEKLRDFGVLVSQAMPTLPASFCGPICDIFLKRHSQYKIYEWMALLHWYVIPIGTELGFDSRVLQNFACFAQAIEFAMILKPRSTEELLGLHQLIVEFLQGYEKIYVGSNPENISKSRLCIFQLIHIPQHILWNGNIRVGSQATVERSIGEMSHRIRSKKEVFTNLANQVYEREQLKILLLYYPTLDNSKTKTNSSEKIIPVRRVKILKRQLGGNGTLQYHLQAICHFLGLHIKSSECRSHIAQWGKVRVHGELIHSCLSDDLRSGNSTTRYSRWFEV